MDEIRVQMLGGPRVWAGTEPVLDSPDALSLPWRLFLLLALEGGAREAAELAAALLPQHEAANAARALEKAAADINGAFAAAAPGCAPVAVCNGRYALDADIRLEVDTERFEAALDEAAAAQGPARWTLLEDALEHYRGDLLGGRGDEAWAAPAAARLRERRAGASGALCEELYRAGEYNRLLAAATTATRHDALDADAHVGLFRALDAMEMNRAIITAYHRLARLFGEELGAGPPAEVVEIYGRAGGQVEPLERDILAIRDDLQQAAAAGRADGPLLCSYEVFKYLYQIVARSSERTGAGVVIVLLTLEAGDDVPARRLAAAMAKTRDRMLGGLLRKSDIVARYSQNQYIVMLSVDKPQSAELVVRRLREGCEADPALQGLRAVFTSAGMEPPA